jgi:hypothetical protein
MVHRQHSPSILISSIAPPLNSLDFNTLSRTVDLERSAQLEEHLIIMNGGPMSP